jgi:hypothetical protein
MRRKLNTEQLLMRLVSVVLSSGLVLYGGYGMLIRSFKFYPEIGSSIVIAGDSALYLGIGFIFSGILLLWVIIRHWHLYPENKDDNPS